MRLVPAIWILVFFCTCACAQNPRGCIPLSRQASWAEAGLLPGTPKRAEGIFDVTRYGARPDDGQDDFQAVHDCLAKSRSQSGLSVIYFPPGTYQINSSIELTRPDSNIIFQGAGVKQTTLVFTVGNNRQCFYIHGCRSETPINLDSSLARGSRSLRGENIDSSSLQAGDWIQLSEFRYPVQDSWAIGAVGQITQLQSIQSRQAVIKEAAAKFYDSANGLRCWKIEPVQNVGIEQLTLLRNDPADSGYGSNFHYQYAVNCWIKGVESAYTCRHHVEVDCSAHLEISGCYFHHARSYGNSGRGYGVDLYRSTNHCLIENNIFDHLRHAMVVQGGANSNVFGYNYAVNQVWDCGGGCPDGYGPDICIHGNYPFANLFEGNSVGLIMADGEHGRNGPYNTFFRNHTRAAQECRLWNSDSANFVANSNSPGLDTDLDELLEKVQNIFRGWRINPSENIIDIYCQYYPGGYPWNSPRPLTHRQWADIIQESGRDSLYFKRSFLNESSYYYNSRPAFLDGYQWPPLGPPTNFDLAEDIDPLPEKRVIPAQDRYNSGKAGH